MIFDVLVAAVGDDGWVGEDVFVWWMFANDMPVAPDNFANRGGAGGGTWWPRVCVDSCQYLSSLMRRLSSLVMVWHLWRAAVVISDGYPRSWKKVPIFLACVSKSLLSLHSRLNLSNCEYGIRVLARSWMWWGLGEVRMWVRRFVVD